MKFVPNLYCAVAISALALFAATAALAQNTRAEVKAEAAATKASQPKGEMSVPNQDKGRTPRPSAVSREAVKAEVLDANASGRLSTGGQTSGSQGKKPPVRATSTESRAAVKADAAATTKASGGLSKGESSQKDQDKGVTKP